MITCDHYNRIRFQFLGIPPKGERVLFLSLQGRYYGCFQFLGIPPKGERYVYKLGEHSLKVKFPISRDPPEGGTVADYPGSIPIAFDGFQFLGIPPKGERVHTSFAYSAGLIVSNF